MDVKLLDMTNIKWLQNTSSKDLYKYFRSAYTMNSLVALKWLLYVRDIERGLGQRRVFQEIITNAIYDDSFDLNDIRKIIPIIPRIGRWDDVLHIIWKTSYLNPSNKSILSLGIYTELYIEKQLQLDLAIAKNDCIGKVSMLAKWLPSINTSSELTCAHAKYLAKSWGVNGKRYRKTLSFLRRYLDITERAMCEQEWDDFPYASVTIGNKRKYNKSLYKHGVLCSDDKPADIRAVRNLCTTEGQLIGRLANSRYNL